MKNLILASSLFALSTQVASAADCPTTLRNFFNSLASQGYSQVYVDRTTSALWNTDNAFSTYSNFSTNILGAAPNRYLKELTSVNFLDYRGQIGRVDKEEVTITEAGTIQVVLNSWANTVTKPVTTYCDAIGKDQMLMQAIFSTGARKTLYNFTLKKTIIVQ